MNIEIVAKTKDIFETVSVLEEIYKQIGSLTLDKLEGKYDIHFVMNKIESDGISDR